MNSSRSKRFMVSAIASTRSDGRDAQAWIGGLGFGSIRARIMAVNIVAVVLLGLALLYLDSVRTRLYDGRSAELARQAATLAAAMGETRPRDPAALIGRLSFPRGTRIRLFAADGRLVADNWAQPGVRRFVLVDPGDLGWQRRAALGLDRAIEWLTAAIPIAPFVEARPDVRDAAPAAAAAFRDGRTRTVLRRAENGTIVVTAAAPVPGSGEVVLVAEEASDLTRVLRRERQTSFLLFLGGSALTLVLSFYLVTTIVRPLRMLALAAQRVRLGRAREVVVPRLPERRDEIGALARALSDMTTALRQRIDATEAFAADVAHELKNPLASLRSAVDTLEGVDRRDLRERLLEVIRDDVARLDRLISDIADASRLDAELSRSRFEPVDLGLLAEGLVAAYENTILPPGIVFAFARPEPDTALVLGESARLAQVLRNLIDNAISFSPNPGTIVVSVIRGGSEVQLRVEDEGPGVPPENRTDVFRRFYSERPAAESFGRHSGLGLAIAGAIVEAHGGTIVAGGRTRGHGASFTVTLPAA